MNTFLPSSPPRDCRQGCQNGISSLKFARGCAIILAQRESWCLLVQDDAQEGIVDFKAAVIPDEAKFPESVHETIDPGACCADHFRQHLLRYFGKHFLRLGFLAIPWQRWPNSWLPDKRPSGSRGGVVGSERRVPSALSATRKPFSRHLTVPVTRPIVSEYAVIRPESRLYPKLRCQTDPSERTLGGIGCTSDRYGFQSEVPPR